MNAASKPDNPKGWLARAHSNLLLAELWPAAWCLP